MSDLRAQLLAAFQVEQKEHLDAIQAVLGRAEKETVSAADLEEIFRRAHTLRAAARACDFRVVEAVGQCLEKLFAQARKGELLLVPENLGTIQAAVKALADWGRAVSTSLEVPEPSSALEILDRLGVKKPAAAVAGEIDLNSRLMAAFQIEHKEHLEGIRAVLAEVERGDVKSARVDEAFRRAHSLKGAARIAELRPAEALAHCMETLFARVRERSLVLDKTVVRSIHKGLDAIEDLAACMLERKPLPDATAALDAIERSMTAPVETAFVSNPAPAAEPSAQLGPAHPVTETMRVQTENLDRLLRSAGQLLNESQRQGLLGRELAGLRRQVEEMEKEWDSVRRLAGGPLRQLAATPGLARITHYLESVERRVRTMSRQARGVHRLHQQGSWALRVLGGQLHQDVRRARLVSAESVFQSFRKMMRDLARDEGKEIEFRVSGFEVEADRMVLQALKDPLMHVLCNAVSHGIEPPEERQSQGKNPAGRVTLHMETVGNRLEILVDDDGRGIDRGRVAEVAVRQGFLREGEADSAAPEEVARLIFRPGFSTARAVTGLAGRGMGLSVVYEAVARLQGEVDLRPKDGPGTTLFLTLPLTAATQRLLLVSCRGQTFAIPIHGIDRLVRVKAAEVEAVEGKPMILLNGQPVPLLGLAYLLNLGEPEVPVEADFIQLLIVRTGSRRLAVAVDAFLEERDSLVKPLEGPAGPIVAIGGGILLEDGSVALVLNLTELVKTARPTDRAAVLKPATRPAEKKRSTVLVVDDSLTTRTLEKSILEAQGYDVRIAMDGVEALEQLRAGPIDLVITDIQMPRLDGFGLLEAMKKDQRLAQVPVIVVTSLEKREDQERGLALGADAYIVKRKFDHQDLLETIRQIL